jgi:hypothetical protein
LGYDSEYVRNQEKIIRKLDGIERALNQINKTLQRGLSLKPTSLADFITTEFAANDGAEEETEND